MSVTDYSPAGEGFSESVRSGAILTGEAQHRAPIYERMGTQMENAGTGWPGYRTRTDREARREGGPASGMASRRSEGRLDGALLARASEVLPGACLDDPGESQLVLETLACVCGELWASAMQCDRNRQELLALVEQVSLSWDCLDAERTQCLREAIQYLGGETVTDAHLEVMRSAFLDVGWKPLAFVGDGDVQVDE